MSALMSNSTKKSKTMDLSNVPKIEEKPENEGEEGEE